jgi:hypothetical protein
MVTCLTPISDYELNSKQTEITVPVITVKKTYPVLFEKIQTANSTYFICK